MIIEALMLAALIYYRSPEVGAIVLALIVCRRVPWFANVIAAELALDQYAGLTAFVARLALPAWRDMSSDLDADTKIPAAPIHVSIPGISATNAIPAGRDITTDAWLVALTEAKDDQGKDLFSANKIAGLIGGQHNQTMARIKEVRTGQVAQFRQDDGSTAPASYPMTKSS